MLKTLNFCNVLILKYKREKISTKLIFPYTSTPGKKIECIHYLGNMYRAASKTHEIDLFIYILKQCNAPCPEIL